jgi:hypothetical protein
VKDVTYKGRADGRPTSGVQVGDTYFPQDTVMHVADHLAEKVSRLEGFKFSVKDVKDDSE